MSEIIELIPVPVPFINTVCKHNPGVHETLIQLKENEYGLEEIPIRPEEINSYRNKFSGNEIEIMIQVFKRAGFDKKNGFGKTAVFRSRYELARLTAGTRNRRIQNFIDAIKTLEGPHWLAFSQKRKNFIAHIAPLKIEILETGEISVHVCPQLIEGKTYRLAPSNPSQILKIYGVKRADTAHIKTFLYMADRIGSLRNGNSLKKLKIYEGAGIAGYFKQRNGNRARKILSDTLEAMQAGGLIDWTDGKEKIIFSYNRENWGQKEPEPKARTVAQVTPFRGTSDADRGTSDAGEKTKIQILREKSGLRAIS
ncbi:MAG: hypothetical protein OEY59_10885 [Deltaproteobacteria bacterium]|nr:hypothetical protein [Deltaproteobacteria bacterium]